MLLKEMGACIYFEDTELGTIFIWIKMLPRNVCNITFVVLACAALPRERNCLEIPSSAFVTGENVKANDLKVGLFGENLVDYGFYFSFISVNCRHG